MCLEFATSNHSSSFWILFEMNDIFIFTVLVSFATIFLSLFIWLLNRAGKDRELGLGV